MTDPSSSTGPAAMPSASYAGPERRAGGPRVTPWLAATLDEVDYGMLLLVDVTRVVHVNHAARAELDEHHPLQLLGADLRVRRAPDVAPLAEALQAAAQRGLRKLLTLGQGAGQVSISVVPLGAAMPSAVGATLVMLGKRRGRDGLAVQGFARSRGLTGAETRVLVGLCAGSAPAEIAAGLGVGIATVRTQIGGIRQKTGADSIRALMQQVAALPPLMSVLRNDAMRRPPVAAVARERVAA